jgi:polyhydroxybutyrate depolymerase
MKNFLWLLSLLLPFNLLAEPSVGGTRQIKLDPLGRTYMLHVPPGYDKTQPAPLVIVLHGAGGNGDHMLADNGWLAKAGEKNFIVAAPNALPVRPNNSTHLLGNPQVWSDGSDRGNKKRGDVDDVSFIAKVIDDISRQYAIDAKRIYLTGHSNGASMTFHAGAALCKRFAAIAPVMGHYWDNVEKTGCALPMLYIAGSKDPLNPLGGGESKDPWGTKQIKPPVHESADKWAKQANCKDASESAANGVTTFRYECAPDSEVVFQIIEGQGHGWPGAVKTRLPQFIIGPSVNTLHATDKIWEFFALHPFR